MEPLRATDIKKKLMDMRRALYQISTRALPIGDKRWAVFNKEVAKLIVEEVKEQVKARMARISQEHGRRVARCKECTFWDPTGAKWGKCTNLRNKQEILSFDPYQIETKAELEKKYKSNQPYTFHTGGCQYGVRKGDISKIK